MTEPHYRVVKAGNIQVGDRVCRARSRAFFEVLAVTHRGDRAVITFEHGESRPMRQSLWWKQTNYSPPAAR